MRAANHTAGALLSIEGAKIYKLIVGPAAQATWYGHWPTNGTHGKMNYNEFVACWPAPCLFEVGSDPSEHVDISQAEPAVLTKMLLRFKELEAGYHPHKQNPTSDAAGICAAMEANGGFLKPWKDARE